MSKQLCKHACAIQRCQGSWTLSNPSVHTACHAIALNRSDTFSFRTTVIIQFWGLYMFITVLEIVLMLATPNVIIRARNELNLACGVCYLGGALCISGVLWCPLGVSLSWKMYRLLLAAMAMMFSLGCQAVWRIFFLKSRLSTLTSVSFRFFPTHTRRGCRTARRLHISRLASRVTSRRLARSNIRK